VYEIYVQQYCPTAKQVKVSCDSGVYRGGSERKFKAVGGVDPYNKYTAV